MILVVKLNLGVYDVTPIIKIWLDHLIITFFFEYF